ncbi:hypothetical protein TNCT_88531 [Trichonephila clavata]|uniref:Uncharacterized protein n=1 Tax=Trichonephila clavata TaxID=2740835 RepID=A0A8X6KPR9_TRICU|nr:hypothetical protein TNCT_88531 [Trichonephila clavata]
MRHLPPHPGHSTRAVTKVLASCVLHQSHRYLHVHVHSLRVLVPHGVCHRQHRDRSSRGKERMNSGLFNDVQLIRVEVSFNRVRAFRLT